MGQGLVTIHVLPHIRRYLLVRLAPGERLTEPTTQDLVNHVSSSIHLDVLHVVPDPEPATKSTVRLAVRNAPPRSDTVARYLMDNLNTMLEETYRRHSHTWMDWFMDTTGAGVAISIETWRSQYGVTVQDQPFETARMAYVRHRARLGRLMPHGGARYGPRQFQQR